MKWTWENLKREDQKRLLELLDETCKTLESDWPDKIERLKKIKDELYDIKRRITGNQIIDLSNGQRTEHKH